MDMHFIKLNYLDFIEELFIKLLCRISRHWRNNVLNVSTFEFCQCNRIFNVTRTTIIYVLQTHNNITCTTIKIFRMFSRFCIRMLQEGSFSRLIFKFVITLSALRYRKLGYFGCSFILVYLVPPMNVPKLNIRK